MIPILAIPDIFRAVRAGMTPQTSDTQLDALVKAAVESRMIPYGKEPA